MCLARADCSTYGFVTPLLVFVRVLQPLQARKNELDKRRKEVKDQWQRELKKMVGEISFWGLGRMLLQSFLKTANCSKTFPKLSDSRIEVVRFQIELLEALESMCLKWARVASFVLESRFSI